MARGTQLLELVDMLRAEVGHAASPALGTDVLPRLKRLIRRHQNQLYLEHFWPFLRMVHPITLQAGNRHYDFPSDLELEGLVNVSHFWAGSVLPIDRGIGPDEYSSFDSEADERTDPVQRWDLAWTGAKTQIEVWPIPATNSGKLQIVGMRKLRALTSNSDVADLDDELIVLRAAAEELAESQPRLAQTKAALARDLLARLKGRANNGSGISTLGGGGDDERRGPIEIRVPRQG